MYCNTPYVDKQFAWNGPFIVVECTLSAYADVQAHSCMHCQDAVGTCVCVLFVCEEECMVIPVCLTGQVAEQRVKADIHSYGGTWPLHTLSCQCGKDSCRLLVLQPFILHVVGRGVKKRISSVPFFLFPPSKHHWKKTKAEQL